MSEGIKDMTVSKKKKIIELNYDSEDSVLAEGLCSVWQGAFKKEDAANELGLKIKGILQLNTYLSDINCLRFTWNGSYVVVDDITVMKETFGSDDETCVYEFESDSDNIKVVDK